MERFQEFLSAGLVALVGLGVLALGYAENSWPLVGVAMLVIAYGVSDLG